MGRRKGQRIAGRDEYSYSLYKQIFGHSLYKQIDPDRRIKDQIRTLGFAPTKDGWFDAIGSNNIPATKLFLELGVPVDSISKIGWTALAHASSRGHIDLIKVLVEAGANINFTAIDHPILLIAFCGIFHITRDETVDILLKLGANVNLIHNGKSLLAMAYHKKFIELANKLLAAGADINARGGCNITPLFEAVGSDLVEHVRYLINVGADVNVIAYDDLSPLRLAVMRNNCQIIKLLVDAGADVNILNREERQIVGKCISTPCVLI